MGSLDSMPCLSLSSVGGDDAKATRDWQDLVLSMHNEAAQRCEGLVVPISLEIVFFFPGKNISNFGFEGVRTGYFHKVQRLQIVQVAVQVDDASRRIDRGDKAKILEGHILKAIDAAERSMKRRSLGSDLSALRAIVRNLA